MGKTPLAIQAAELARRPELRCGTEAVNTVALTHVARSAAARIASRVLGWGGLKVSRANVIGSWTHLESPIEAYYQSKGTPFVWSAPAERCRILHTMAFPCSRHANNPFVEALLQHERNPSIAFKDTALCAYYENVQPKSAAEALGLAPHDSAALTSAPPLEFVFPWSHFSPNEAHQLWLSGSYLDSLSNFRLPTTPHEWKCWGPVSSALGELEFQRLISIYASIKRSGYRRSDRADGDIGGTLLTEDEDSCILISPGHHRIAALTALGIDQVPVRLSGPVVRRTDVRNWPNVRNGTFTEDTALAVFDRLMAGAQPGFREPRDPS